jgi:hypothetical protein
VSEHDIDDEPRATDDEGTPSERDRPDPRLRPPDPAGTQPKWDPDELLPKTPPPAASGRLWATDAEGEGEGQAEGQAETAYSAAAGEPALATASGASADASPAGAASTAADDDAPRYSRYSARFQFLLGALLAVGAASIALLVAVVAGGQDDTRIVVKAGPQWSEWRPTATGVDAAEQIAKHVGAHYKLANGKQLVLVTGGALEVEQIPVTIAIQQPAAKGGSVDLIDDGAGVLYRLNGVGTQDGHLPGTPSRNRHLLLRREALELALYSFRYLGVSEAVVLFPPTADQNAASSTTPSLTGTTKSQALPTALLFRRDQADVQAALAQPLKSTLTKETPSVSGVTRAADSRAVSAITNDKVYTYKLQQANTDLRLFLVLNPIKLR